MFILTAGALAGLYVRSRSSDPPATPVSQLPTFAPLATISPSPAAALATLPPTVELATLSPSNGSTAVLLTPESIPIATPIPEETSPSSAKIAFNLPAALDPQPIPPRANTDLERMFQVDYPFYDYYQVAKDLGGFTVGPREFERPEFEIGDRQIFHTEEGNVEATLITITEHTYFWVDDSLYLEEADVNAAARRLEENFLPRINHLFDQPWSPGIDGIERFSILHLAGNGNQFELGYFSDKDEYPRTIFRDSNEQEIVYLNMGQLDIGSELYFGTLVHELQHLFQWNLDKNESTWLNEGISQLAEIYAGLDTAKPDAYLAQPDTRLDRWEYDAERIDAHYANSYLFTVYLWEQLGEMGVYELVRQPANGLAAVEIILQGFQPERSLEEFTADWAVANFLDDPSYGEQYAYTRLDLAQPTLQTRARQLPFSDFLELNQLAVHYIDIDQSGPLMLSFAGNTTAQLIDVPPVSGEQMWYAPPANDTHAQLTASFDLRQLDQATLEFDAWYDLEEDFDFAYISVSNDQGATWKILSPDLWSSGNYGPGMTGSSAALTDDGEGWVHETVSLDSFAGQDIMVRFHVLTDFESVGRGFAIDNIAIPELNYASDVEAPDSRWQANGFVPTGWLLPQRWSVQVIRHGASPEVITIELDAFNQAQKAITLGLDGGTLVVMPLTPFVTDAAHYWVEISN